MSTSPSLATIPGPAGLLRDLEAALRNERQRVADSRSQDAVIFIAHIDEQLAAIDRARAARLRTAAAQGGIR